MPALRSPTPPRNTHQDSVLTYDERVEGFTYDPASQVTAISHQLSAISAEVNKAEYAYNPVGNRTSLTDRRGSQAFGYDSLDRLTSASHPLLATPQAFAYDAVGNRTTGGSVVNAGNQLTADANFIYEYDANGNQTNKTNKITNNSTLYTYDAENRLTKVEDFVAGASTPAATSTYRYDGLGRRIQKTLSTQSSALSTSYVYDGEDMLLEYDGANVLQAHYTHGSGIDEPIAVTKGSSTFFYHQDGLGTVTDLTDSTGATAKSYSYDAYGTLVDQAGTVDQPYTYTGREFDAETGLYYYRARTYDSAFGRFLQQDPVGIEEGRNMYVYVENRPTRYNDPHGLYTVLPGVPMPSPIIGALLRCIEAKTNMPLTVTSTSKISKQHPAGTPHPRGVAVDIRYPSDPDKVLCAAAGCGAGFALDEKKHPSVNSDGPHIHIQIPRGKKGGRGDLPKAGCENCNP